MEPFYEDLEFVSVVSIVGGLCFRASVAIVAIIDKLFPTSSLD